MKKMDELPKNCAKCSLKEFREGKYCGYWCRRTDTRLGMTLLDLREGRHEDCPLEGGQ